MNNYGDEIKCTNLQFICEWLIDLTNVQPTKTVEAQ